MLSILSSIGIDFKMLAVQIVNFLILLFVLKKFVYHPIIKKIEKDEKELDKARRETAKIEHEKDEINKDQKQAIAKTKKRAEEIISEAEMISNAIKEEAKTTMQRRLINQDERLDNLQESYKSTWERKWSKKKQEEIYRNVLEIFNNFNNDSIEVGYRELFFNLLIEKLKKIIDEDSEGEIANQEIKLEYAHAILSEQKKQLEQVFKQRELTLLEQHNSELLNGFRLEISGRVIEANLMQEIQHAINSQK